MRGTALSELIQMLRRELKVAESPSLGKNTRESHAYALRSAQDRLYAKYDWPFKNIDCDIPMQAGQRYYAPPANLNFESIRSAAVYYSGQWFDFCRGIGPENYNIFNSDLDARNDPVTNWRIYNDATDNGDMIEAWPIPATNNLCTMRFSGERKLRPLIADTDVCDLDDQALVLMAATDFVDAKRLVGAQAKAADHIFTLVRNLAEGRTFVSGGGANPREGRRYPPRIIISPAASGGS